MSKFMKVWAVLLCLVVVVGAFAACDQETKPEIETVVLPMDTFQGMDKDTPYTLEFQSNGDGTCTLTKINHNMLYQKSYILEIPATSPDGETVVAIADFASFPGGRLPHLIPAEDFDEIKHRIGLYIMGATSPEMVTTDSEGQYGYENDSYYRQFVLYFIYRGQSLLPEDVPDDTRDRLRDDLITVYPVLADEDLVIVEYDLLATFEEQVSTEMEIITAFPEYTSAKNYLNERSTEYIDEPYYSAGGEYVTKIIIPNTVKSIGSWAFAMYNHAVDIMIPDSVTSIGDMAFGGCSSLTNITIPNSVTSIGGGVFSFCPSLTSIAVAEGNTAYKSVDGHLLTKDGTMLIQYAEGKTDTGFVIPDSVISIGDGAFKGCRNLTDITIPDSVTSIGGEAFRVFSSLTDIYFTGTKGEWKVIEGIADAKIPSPVTIHYNYKP